jgi:hypothetical protein
MMIDIRTWVLEKLELVKDYPRVLIIDSLWLLPESDGMIHQFANDNGFTAIVASTNLVFRELYEHAIDDPETKKILIIDRAPLRRRTSHTTMQAPPLFYPDILSKISQDARIVIDLRQFLRETTGDPDWHQDVNIPAYARLITKNFNSVLRAHKNLRTANPGRFTDNDFKRIVAYASLGIGELAFKKLDAKDYWKIGLLGHEALNTLDSLTPEITTAIKGQLLKAPKPFSWFAQYDPEDVIRALYLALILSQHIENWQPLLANICYSLKPFSEIDTQTIKDAAQKLIEFNSAKVQSDLEELTKTLDKATIQFIVITQLKMDTQDGFFSAVTKEHFSVLIRSLALFMVLSDVLSNKPAWAEHTKIAEILFSPSMRKDRAFIDSLSSGTWSRLKEAYRLALNVQNLKDKLVHFKKNLDVTKTTDLSFKMFAELWGLEKVSRLEYYLSSLERIVDTADLLPCQFSDLPDIFTAMMDQIRKNLQILAKDVYDSLNQVNLRFQEMVKAQYPEWIKAGEKPLPLFDTYPILTSQFIRRCLKKHWNPYNEKAMLLIFDGMRYDIWDDLLKPMLLNRMDVLEEFPGSSLIPSETHITRKAISAGTFPDEFNMKKGEDYPLRTALLRELKYVQEVEVVTPEGSGTGETVHYRAGNLDVYIFELCDKELHKIGIKSLKDGRFVPARPLAFIYDQYIKDMLTKEVMAIVRTVSPETKIFIVADHGFGRIGRSPLSPDENDLCENTDCSYLNCWLKKPFADANLTNEVQGNIIAFTPEELRMPKEESHTLKAGPTVKKTYKTIIFPKTGYSFSRPGSPYKPDAYSHGGISMQELIIPMVALKVRTQQEGFLVIDQIKGPTEAVEGEEIEFQLKLVKRKLEGRPDEDVRVDVEAVYSREPDRFSLPHQALFVPQQGIDVVYCFVPNPEDASTDERRQGRMERVINITVSYSKGNKVFKNSRVFAFAVKLNTEQIIRRVGSLGGILGLTPKSMKGKING